MILVIGAAASGKRTYVKQMGYTDADIADAVLDDRPVIENVQDLVRRDPDNVDVLLQPLSEKHVVICDEVGSGVIPADPLERKTREQTGRLCVLLAQKAERVIRLVCGIPSVIKG